MRTYDKHNRSEKKIVFLLYFLIIIPVVLFSVLSTVYYALLTPISYRGVGIYILGTVVFILVISVFSGYRMRLLAIRNLIEPLISVAGILHDSRPDGSFRQKAPDELKTLQAVAEEASGLAIEIREAITECIKNGERFRLVMSATGDGLFDWNLLTGDIFYSTGWKSMLGYGTDELSDEISVWEDLTESEGAARAMAMLQEMIAGKMSGFNLEYRMKHKDGHWVDIHARAEAVFDESGKAVRIVGTHTDISFRKRIEAQLRNKTTELEAILHKNEKQRIANLTLLNDFNITTKSLKEEIASHEKAELALKNSHNQLRQLAQHLQNVREQQSSYIAMEIHDDLGQSLTSLGMILSLLEERFIKAEISDDSISGFIRELRTELDATVEKTRQLTRSLRPLILETADIVEAVEWQVEEFSKITRGTVVFERCDEAVELDEDRDLAVFRLVQEALNNINKHANASEIIINLSCEKHDFIISIRDNGEGFDPSDDTHKNSFGLLNMKERAFFCDGELSVVSTKGAGTEVKLSLPIDKLH